MKEFKLLDLYCGAGLAAWGYWLSGCFSEIVGVDIDDMSSSYSFDFVRGDVTKLTYEFISQFDFIHASPPCQAYSKVTPDKSRHQRLIPGTRLICVASGLPYVIENVEGSGADLKPNVVMNGGYVGLRSSRKRYFHVSVLMASSKLIRGVDSPIVVNGSQYVRRESMVEAMGLGMINPNALNRMTMKHIEQGVPPAMTLAITRMLKYEKLLVGGM